VMCGKELVELWKGCVCDLWGRVCRILERIFVICFGFQIIYFLSNTPVHLCTYSVPSRFSYKTTSQVHVFRRLWVLKSPGLF